MLLISYLYFEMDSMNVAVSPTSTIAATPSAATGRFTFWSRIDPDDAGADAGAVSAPVPEGVDTTEGAGAAGAADAAAD